MSTITITNNFHAPIGQHIDHVDKIEAHFDKDMGMQISLCDTPPQPSTSTEPNSSPTPSPSPSEPYLAQSPSIDQYLTVSYRDKRKSDYENMLSVIRQSSWSDKDHARFALAIYNSNILVPRTKPNTFSEWYQLFCNMFGFTYNKNYEPCKLTPNKASRQIELYL